MPGGFPLGLEVCNGQSIGANTAASNMTALTYSGTANTKGAWKQLIASTSYDACWAVITVTTGYDGDLSAAFDIGVGSSGSEVAIINDLIASGSYNGQNDLLANRRYSFPIQIPAGTRLSGRCQRTSTGTSGIYGPSVQIHLFDGSFTQMEGAAGVDAIGFTSGTTLGTTIVPGTNTPGSYAQLSSSTSRDYIGFLLGFDAQGNVTGWADYLVDFAIGASGSEKNIVPQSALSLASGVTLEPAVFPFCPISVPAGTRIAARAAIDVAVSPTTNDTGLTMYGVYQ